MKSNIIMDIKIDRNYARKCILDFIPLFALGMPLLLLNTIANPFIRGYNCDDESIRYPYKDNTIPSFLLYIYGFGIPIITIITIELYNTRKNLNNEDEWKGFLWRVYCEFVPFIFGVETSQLITDTAKYSIGRLRPHFIDVCNPNISCGINTYQYITNYRCMNTDVKKIKDSRLSFMSGHASFSAFCMTYAVFYIQHKLDKRAGLVKKLIQFALLYLAIYTGFTRISDYKHHWSDVLVGWLQGTTVAILISIYVAKLHQKRQDRFYKPWSQIPTTEENSAA